MSATNINAVSKVFFIYVFVAFVLLLTSVNIGRFLAPKKVLGAEAQGDSRERFWQNFLVKNPNYIPGWIEIDREDKAHEIDPNYVTP